MESIPEHEHVIAVDVHNHVKSTTKSHSGKSLINNDADRTPPRSQQEKAQKKIKKGIFISYSPDSGYLERAFISDLVRQLKENNLAEDIWFDKDENCIDSPIWFSQRMDAVEKCQAAILIISDQYFTCPVTVYEARTLIERQLMDAYSVKIFPVKFSELHDTELPRYLEEFLSDAVDITSPTHQRLSVPEKTSLVIGQIMERIEKFAVVNMPMNVSNELEPEFDGEYKNKKMCRWNVSNLQEWLYNLGIKEYYRQIMAEKMVDGFLLMSITDSDMTEFLGIDSRVVRKKIMQHIISLLDKEHKMADNWHLRARSVRSRPNTVYLIYDPADVRLAQTFKQDLIKKGLQAIHHQKLGQSKEEFLRLNGPYMATSTYVLLILTDHSSMSPFVFHETLFADWLGKKIIVCLFKNDWAHLRPAMRAIAGECLAVDFERNLYAEGMEILEHHLKPIHSHPGVILEQSYLNKMAEGLQPLAKLATCNADISTLQIPDQQNRSTLFISFQWDMQSKVEEIQNVLESSGFTCWSDSGACMRGHSSLSTRATSSNLHASHEGHDTLKSNIQRNMRDSSLVICCITPKYIHSDNCVNDLKLAETLNKPVLALLLRFCSWPPEATLPSVRKMLVKCIDVIELYNDKLFKQNLSVIPEKVHRLVSYSQA